MSRRARLDRAIRGPASAVPSTAASSAIARAAAPARPRGALTAPLSATTSRPARKRCAATATTGRAQRRSARRGGSTGSYGGFALQKDRGEDPALGESPEREQEAYEQHGAAVIVKEDGRPNTYRGGNQRDEGDSHEVEQHRAGDPDEDHLDATLQPVTSTQS